MNQVVLMGRFTKDPETRMTGDKCYTRFTLAVDRRVKKDGEQNADFPSCVAFGKTAEFIGKYFRKGSKAVVGGRLQTGSYTRQNGEKAYTTDVIVDSVDFCEKRQEGAETAQNASGGVPTGAPGEEQFMKVPDTWEEELPFN